jgi:hypothetical protein
MKKQKQIITILSFILLMFINLTLRSQVFINEIMVNPSGTNDGANMPNTAEWIELYNASASPVNIGCWFFTDGDFAVTFPAGTTIPAGGYYTVASASGSGLTPNLNWATCGCTSGPASEVGIFTNSAEQVILYNSSGTIEDAIIWSTGQLPDAMTTSVVGSCASQSVTFPASGATYESIGSHTDGVAKERSVDGRSTWQNAPTATFGATNAIILNIELLDFKAELKNNQVELTWITSNEINNDFFTIERSIDGVTFESQNIIKGAGNSLNTIIYTSEDETPLVGTTYYRLKQTDFDGSYSYSKIESVYLNKSNRIEVYPNPNETGLLKITTGNSNTYEVKLIDCLGRIIYESKLDLFYLRNRFKRI